MGGQAGINDWRIKSGVLKSNQLARRSMPGVDGGGGGGGIRGMRRQDFGGKKQEKLATAREI